MKSRMILPLLVVALGAFGCAPKTEEVDSASATTTSGGDTPTTVTPTTPNVETSATSGTTGADKSANAASVTGEYTGSFIPGSALAEEAANVTKNELKLAEGGKYVMTMEYKDATMNSKSEGTWKQDGTAVVLTPAKINGKEIPAGQSQTVRFETTSAGVLENKEAGLRFARR